ncbi:hypothetical protein K437DRAFT_272709 [Tilletiaria anomala UBC 951]|uniref:Calcofluor white hypersensitive protein n=1 Tax=Tilletiaria anomala (strain ATCC 24038 / CBS 436.72 / UBC 951) TaxID=1037660 RepID=A0A066WMD9_TILAU|nr:uncharacterized protein K437DRAFT_272709 [Tilletiaria anomala UBC 951]KDN52169.1 hypothetical protein K437DRAFT_272709 [Tilletiaria anomala UBC 951]
MPCDLNQRGRTPLVTISGALVSYLHTVLGFLSFFGALVLALGWHYKQVVKNGIAGWPDEWWPSVSATIGDWYPERNVFQIGIALMSGPRFALVFLSALLVSLASPSHSRRAVILAITGTARTFACGGWVYVTSTDDHDFHDMAMVAYLLLTPAWMYISGTSLSLSIPANPQRGDATAESQVRLNKGNRLRKIAAAAFFGMIPFMVFFFYRHKVLEIPGAYTHYAFLEWGLIVFDLLFDAASVYDLSRLEIHIVEATEPSKTDGPLRLKDLVDGAFIRGGPQEAIASGAWNASETLGRLLPRLGRSSSENAVDEQLKGHNTAAEMGPTRVWIAFASDVYLNFVFWTNTTGLLPTLFFFSVYNLSIGGEEAAVLSQAFALGLLLLLWPIRKALVRNDGHVGLISSSTLALLHALTLPSMACWWWSSQHGRLLLVILGAGLGSIALAVEWGRAWELGTLNRKLSTWLFALLITNVAKYANHSNHPLWVFMNNSNGGQNLIGLTLALAALCELYFRPTETMPAAIKRRFRTPRNPLHGTVAALGLGSMLYALPMFISDSGTMIAWTWTGYPVKGPMALTHGCFVIALMAMSVLLAHKLSAGPTGSALARHPAFFALGCAAFYALLKLNDWPAFLLGALPIAFWLPITMHPILQFAMQFNPIRISAAAWLVASIMVFFEVLTVAYAFVPVIGPMMREKTWLMLCAQQAFVGLSLLYCKPDGQEPEAEAKEEPVAYRTRSLDSTKNKDSRFFNALLVGLVAAVLASATVPFWRKVAVTPTSHPEERLVTAGIHTVHFGHDQHLYDSTRRLSSIYKEMDLDIIGMLETDLHRVVYGNRDLTQWLSQEMGMYADIGPSPKGHTWGAVLLSKFPIINSTHHLLPSPHGELAPAIEAWLDIYGVQTQVIVSHNGQEEDPLDRELQTKRIAELFSNAWPNPALFLGYVVTKPHAERPSPYKILFEDGRIQDVDPTDMDRWCEYIGFRALERVGYVRVSRFTVSDTELQTIKLRIPPIGYQLDPDTDPRPQRMSNDSLPLSWQYPWHFYAPTAMVYNQHMYFPRYLPDYFAVDRFAPYDQWSVRWEPPAEQSEKV